MAKPPKGPTLSTLIENRQALRLACNQCGRERFMSPLEAIANYGGSITFSELRALLHARCGAHCQAVIEPSIKRPDELVWKKHIS